MKFSNLTLLLLLSIFAVSFSSCDDDEDGGVDFLNGFVLDNTNYETPRAFIEEYGVNDSTETPLIYDFDLILTSNSISLSGDTLLGTGEIVYFDLNTANESGLADGNYTLNFTGDRVDLAIVDAFLAINVDINGDDGEIDATAAAVTIGTDGSDRTVSYSMTLADGRIVTGSYRGTFQTF